MSIHNQHSAEDLRAAGQLDPAPVTDHVGKHEAAWPRRRSLADLIGSHSVDMLHVFISAPAFTELSVFHSADARPAAAGGTFPSESRSLLASVHLKKLTWTFPLMHRRLSHVFFKELQCFGVVLGFFFALLYGRESYI